jgi:Xaa-Pro aminopeptidase
MSRSDLERHVRDSALDVVVAASPENVYFLSDTLLLTQRLIPTRLALVVWSSEADPVLIVCTIEEEQVRNESSIRDVRGYFEFKQSPIAVLADVLTEKGLAAGRIGIESRFLAHRYFRELAELLPRATLVDGDEVLDRARVIKSSDEIDRLTRAAQITDRAIRLAFEGAGLGTTELHMADTMASELLSGGANGVAFNVMTTGVHSSMAHPLPSRLEIKPQDVVRTDFGGNFGAYFGGYYSDLARTAVAGTPSQQQETTYKKLFEVHDLLLRTIKPGVRPADLYAQCKSAFEQRGLAFSVPHIGHNIGIVLHEDPMLSPFGQDELQAGMVLAVEPITRSEGMIFHIEDMVVVTESGCRPLSDPYPWSELMRIK